MFFSFEPIYWLTLSQNGDAGDSQSNFINVFIFIYLLKYQYLVSLVSIQNIVIQCSISFSTTKSFHSSLLWDYWLLVCREKQQVVQSLQSGKSQQKKKMSHTSTDFSFVHAACFLNHKIFAYQLNMFSALLSFILE